MNNLKFNELDKYFRDNKFELIESDEYGERFLKLRSISRNKELLEFCEFININNNVLKDDLFCCLFKNSHITIPMINNYIRTKYQSERILRKNNEAYLIDQLFRLPYFDWGGSFGNSLEKNIVDNYVKKIQDYQKINDEIDGSLLKSLRGYTLNSWYNHWTSIIIEDIFKDHNKVLPTVGLVKKIDFFINNIPFDLKVTYYPQELMNEKLKEIGCLNEKQCLYRKCIDLGICVEDTDNASNLRLKIDQYQNNLTQFIKQNSSEINILKEKCNDLGINFNNYTNDYELKKELLNELRNFRDELKNYPSSVKYQSELTKIKKICIKLNIVIPNDMSDKALEQHLYNKLIEDNSTLANEFILEFKRIRKQIINESEQNPNELKKWLYENQGEARFDASNRFFLILTDENDIYDSWKLKRNINYLKEKINNHLDNISDNSADLELEFYWKQERKRYKCKSDILFVKK